MLLSIDSIKRPSCNEILTKLRSIRRDETASIFQDIPSEWNSTSTNTNTQAASTNGNPPGTTIKSPSPLNENTIIIDTEEITSSQDEPYVHRTATKHRHSSSSISEDRGNSTSTGNNTLRKRQRLLGKEELNKDSIMRESDEDGDNEQEEEEAPRLLLGSPDLAESHHSARWLSDHHFIQIIKIVTVVLKVTYFTKWCNTHLICCIDCILYIFLFSIFSKT